MRILVENLFAGQFNSNVLVQQSASDWHLSKLRQLSEILIGVVVSECSRSRKAQVLICARVRACMCFHILSSRWVHQGRFGKGGMLRGWRQDSPSGIFRWVVAQLYWNIVDCLRLALFWTWWLGHLANPRQLPLFNRATWCLNGTRVILEVDERWYSADSHSLFPHWLTEEALM